MPNLLTTIGTALFGERGLAGGVVDTLQSVGILKDPKEAQAALERMKALELRGDELDLDKLKATIADQSSARDMQKGALAQEDKFAKRFVYYYAIGITSFSFVYFFAVTMMTLDVDQRTIANIILGFLLGTGLATIISFFYGTSYGSLQKNKQIEILSSKKE